MSDGTIDIWLILQTREMEAQLAEQQAKIDAQRARWNEVRTDIAASMSIINTSMSIALRVMQQVTDESQRALLQTIQSCMTMLNSAVGAMYAVAAGYFATGVLAPIGAALMGFLAGMSAGQQIALLAAQSQVQTHWGNMQERLRSVEGKVQQGFMPIGGRTG